MHVASELFFVSGIFMLQFVFLYPKITLVFSKLPIIPYIFCAYQYSVLCTSLHIEVLNPHLMTGNKMHLEYLHPDKCTTFLMKVTSHY